MSTIWNDYPAVKTLGRTAGGPPATLDCGLLAQLDRPRQDHRLVTPSSSPGSWLHAIDAPELDQTFWWRGQQLVCGTMALAALEALTAGVKVRCEAVERDRHGRLVAKVFTPNGVDIGRRLVSAGWALAYRRYSADFVDAEHEARQAKRGMWRGTFVKPWAWCGPAAHPTDGWLIRRRALGTPNGKQLPVLRGHERPTCRRVKPCGDAGSNNSSGLFLVLTRGSARPRWKCRLNRPPGKINWNRIRPDVG